MAANMEIDTVTPGQGGPFDLGNDEVYKRWRDWKLEAHPKAAGDLVVEIKDPFNVSDVEYTAVLDRVRRGMGGKGADHAPVHRPAGE